METMNLMEMKQKIIRIIEKWNPFDLVNFSNEREALDVAEIVQFIDDPSELGKRIQLIFEHSFNEWIPFEKCVEISYKLLAIKFEAKSIL